jgi:GTP cyclohydrolase IA
MDVQAYPAALAPDIEELGVDEDARTAEHAVAALLTALGFDADSDRLRDTPRRVAASLRHLVTPAPMPPSTFIEGEGYDGPVELRGIPFHSLCEHHLLPFRGVVHVGYLPNQRIVGISTLPRIVEHFARDLQVQERLTAQIADWLELELLPRGLVVTVEAEHLCMSMRNVGGPATRVTTRVVRGESGALLEESS